MKQVKLHYNECAHLIKEADVLLFRAPRCILSIGWWIAKLGFTAYSHVGLAHYHNNHLHCVEFREFIGSRSEPLSNQFEYRPELEIDVYRVHSAIERPFLTKHDSFFNPNKYCIHQEQLSFTPEIAKKITSRAEKLVGKSYSWKVIYQIGKTFVPGLRFFIEKNSKENGYELFVCSTLVSYTYRKEFIDLCPLISDLYTQPSDLARSAHLNYLFTITK